MPFIGRVVKAEAEMYRVLWQGRVIGESRLENTDSSMGVLNGVFIPGPAYRDVEPVFRLYRQAGTSVADMDEEKMRAFFDARDGLALSLVSENGQPLPVNTIHIDGYAEELGEYEVTVWTDGTSEFGLCDSAGNLGPASQPPALERTHGET
jgi:hypothetical protein